MTSVPPPRLSIGQILDPRTVAVFGASDDKSKFGGRILHYLVRHAFRGTIVPINPKRETVLGLRCYPTIADVPHPVDVAVLAVPPAAIRETAALCAQAGVGCCVVITTGFAEAGHDGQALQRDLVADARRAGMRIVGPNCMGFMNLQRDLCLTSSFVLEVDRLRKGGIGLVSQSGALMVSMFNRAHDAGIGFSTCVSLGNQSDVDICDVFEHLIADRLTRVICIYIEGLKDGRRFLDLAERARAAGKPVLVVKTGRTEAGVRAAQSHTASLAGSYPVFAAVCRDAGVVVTDDPDGMIAAAALIERFGAPRGDGIGLLSTSGGGAGIAIDRMGDVGLRAARLAEATRAGLLERLLPPQADNPVDLGGRLAGDSVAAAGEITALLARDSDVAVLFVVLTTAPFYEATTGAIAQAAIASGKPALVAVTPGSAADGARRVLREHAVPFCDRLDDAIRMLAIYRDCGRVTHAAAAPRRLRPNSPPNVGPLPAGALGEHETKGLLHAYGIPVTREALVSTRAQAIDEARAIGFPVALKACVPGLVHKSDVGAVRLGLEDATEVGVAFDAMQAALRAKSIGFDAALVQEMVSDGVELIVGAKLDAQFGPVVLVGSGGVLVELLRDIQIRLAPIDEDAALELLQRLALWPILDGYRGRPKLDVGAAARAVSRVSELACDLAPRLAELDVNPLIVLARGVVAVDARATIR